MAYDGSCEEKYGESRRLFTPFTMSFMPTSQSHSLRAQAHGVRSFGIDVCPKWLDGLRINGANFRNSVYCRGGWMVQLAVRLFREFNCSDASTAIATEGIVLEMLAEVCREMNKSRERRTPKWMDIVIESIHTRSNTSISLTELAATAGVHPVYLAKCFRQSYGCSIGEYSRRLRIERACQLLGAGLIPVSQVACDCGFYDQSHFTRVFKQVKGVTPREYQNLTSS